MIYSILYIHIYIYVQDKLDIFSTSHFESLIQYPTLILNNDIAVLYTKSETVLFIVAFSRVITSIGNDCHLKSL